MKPSILSTLLVLALGSSVSAGERILEVKTGRVISRNALHRKMARVEEVVVGEKHDTASIQNAEAKLFRSFAAGKRQRVTLAWEFFNWSEKPKLDAAYARFVGGEINSTAFLEEMFGKKNPELTYAPLLEEAKRFRADLLPTNLTRAEKAPVSKSGIGALDPKLLPVGFEVGGAGYFERFVLAMGGHGDPKQIENYFASQSLVDDVVAHHMSVDRSTRPVFLVIGNFHSQYFDGVWKRLKKRSSSKKRMLIQVVNPTDESDWGPVMNHPKYGHLADFVVFVD